MSIELITLFVFAFCAVSKADVFLDVTKIMKRILCDPKHEELAIQIKECGAEYKEAQKSVGAEECYSDDPPTESQEDAVFCELDVETIAELAICVEDKMNEAENAEELKKVAERFNECVKDVVQKRMDRKE